MKHTAPPYFSQKQELTRSLSNIIHQTEDKSSGVVPSGSAQGIQQSVLNQIRELEKEDTAITFSPPTQNRPLATRSVPNNSNANPLRANSGLYFRDILKRPDESVTLPQSIRSRGTRFSENEKPNI